MTIAAGIDVGTGAVKAALFRVENGRDRLAVARGAAHPSARPDGARARRLRPACSRTPSCTETDVDYVATTGEGEGVPFHTGHFYSMTTHARGAIYLDPESRAALDVGALHGRAISIDERGKVLSYKMTSQCASGSGQFLENIARYLGIAQDEIGTLSRQADNPEIVSSICAVLAETDVINMVSRGISASNILKGIHLSMAGPPVEAAEVDRRDRGRGDDDRRARARSRPGRRARGRRRQDEGHEGHDPQPPGLDLRRRDRRRAVGRVSVTRSSPRSGNLPEAA